MNLHPEYPTGKAIVDDSGAELFFVDSGAVPNSRNYTTVILVHGSGANGRTLYHLVPYAAASNIRLIIPNRRDYAGSTPYTDQELEALKKGQDSAMENIAKEMARLCRWFIETQSLPRISSDRKNGGIVLMGWSLGNATTISLFGWPDAIGKETLGLLEGYIRRLVVWDAPHLALGLLSTQPSEGYNPFIDPALKTPIEMTTNFCNWVTSYYNHPDLSLREGTAACLDFKTKSAEEPRPTIWKLVDPEGSEIFKSDMFELTALGRSEMPMYFEPMQSTLKRQTYEALWNGVLTLPQVDVVWMTGTRTNWYCIWGWFEAEKRCKSLESQSRSTTFVEVEGANHMVNWDEPQKFWDALVTAVAP